MEMSFDKISFEYTMNFESRGKIFGDAMQII
jgi:hypothetical protein